MKKNGGLRRTLRAPVDSIDWVLFHHEGLSIDRVDFGSQWTYEVSAADFATLPLCSDDFPAILGCAVVTPYGM